MPKAIRIGTRPSRLAFKQVEEVRDLLKKIRFEVVAIETAGDKDKVTSLAGLEKTDFFTRDIEKALQDGQIDAAIHSAKDVETVTPPGLIIVATTRSVSPHECLVSRNSLKLKELPKGAVVGTSSRKRQEAIMRFRKDLIIKNIRGDIDERLKQLDKGIFDAIIVAHAALIRLGYEDRITELISPDIIEPHPLQGRLSVQIRSDRHDMINIFGRINEK
ncbi:MAG: hydroxymethylbilane synthase [Candidatus Omnitrophica bacterium]|nr:hydroxymethylbilane synthase [Candidatus Omnitrophota bacterium]